MCGDPRHEGISPQTGSHSATALPLRRNTAKTNKHDFPNPKYVKTFLEKRKIRCCENISLLHICFKHPFITLVFMCRVFNLDLSFRQCAHTPQASYVQFFISIMYKYRKTCQNNYYNILS